MTISEAKDILETRLGWRDDGTVSGFSLSTPNTTTVSGRFFQAEHSAVTLENIRDCQPIVDIGSTDFNSYLEDIRAQVVLQVLSGVFEKDYLNDNLLTYYPNGFDNMISMRMTMFVAELIASTTRINNIERLTKGNFLGKLRYDVFRDQPLDVVAKYNMSVSLRYAKELTSVQRRFGSQRNLLKTITKGQVANPYREQY